VLADDERGSGLRVYARAVEDSIGTSSAVDFLDDSIVFSRWDHFQSDGGEFKGLETS
jgi:hypothetical protein